MKMRDDPLVGEDAIRAIAAEVGQLYPAVYRRFRASRQPVPGANVTPRMLEALGHLAASGPLTVGELVQHLHLSKPATTELMDRLEARGLVERMHDERDRRRVFIWLTDAGRERVMAHPRVLEDDLLALALARMRAEDRANLVPIRITPPPGTRSRHRRNGAEPDNCPLSSPNGRADDETG